MKICFLLLVAAFGVSSCARSLDRARAQGNEPGQVERRYFSDDPCSDSLFLALKSKPYASMTAYEHSYFQMMFDRCNETPEVHQGSTPEWIVAIPIIVGIVVFAIKLLIYH